MHVPQIRSEKHQQKHNGGPNGDRTRVSALRGPRPRPLDDGAGWLRDEDSNLDDLIQSQADYHYPIPQHGLVAGPGNGRELARNTGAIIASPPGNSRGFPSRRRAGSGAFGPDRVADADGAVGQDLDPEAAPVHERLHDAGQSGELLQVLAGRAESDGAHPDLAQKELLPD